MNRDDLQRCRRLMAKLAAGRSIDKLRPGDTIISSADGYWYKQSAETGEISRLKIPTIEIIGTAGAEITLPHTEGDCPDDDKS